MSKTWKSPVLTISSDERNERVNMYYEQFLSHSRKKGSWSLQIAAVSEKTDCLLKIVRDTVYTKKLN